MRVWKLLAVVLLLASQGACTLLGTAGGPLMGTVGGGALAVRFIESEEVETPERVGVIIGFPAFLVMGMLFGTFMGPAFGVGADIDFVETGEFTFFDRFRAFQEAL